jgi:RNA polymerase sigma factor (sigma-70 family)
MAQTNLSDFLRRLTRGMAAETLADHSDRQLVEKALATRDEVAFQAIVHRHGPMVYRVCWRVLQPQQDVEDAFQSTFLVLAQKLRSVRKHASLASWLHGVAHRVALKSKAQSAARWRREHQASATHTVTPDEFQPALDFELSRLPDKWRLPLVLCYLEGRTQDESARQLGWSKSTLRRRLEEARTALGCRLNGRGMAWPAALSAVLVSDCITSAAPAPGLVASTVAAAGAITSGKSLASVSSANVAALTKGVLKTMFLSKLKTVTAVFFLISLVPAGIGGLAYATLAQERSENRQETQAKQNEKRPENIQDARVLVERAKELDLAKAEHKLAEVNLKQAQAELAKAQQRYEEAQEHYEVAKGRGTGQYPSLPWAAQSKEGTTVSGRLVKMNPEKSSIMLEYWKEARGGMVVMHMAYEDFLVSKDAMILQDNAKVRLPDLKGGAYIRLELDGKIAVRITADGGTVPGPVRYVSSNQARNTITVIGGKNDERRVYHLLKETEVTTDSGKVARLPDIKEGTMLHLTRSAEDANTVIRIEIIPSD